MKRLGRWLLRGLLLAAAVVLAVQLWFFGHIVWWTRFDPTETSFMRAEGNRLAAFRRGLGGVLHYREKST